MELDPTTVDEHPEAAKEEQPAGRKRAAPRAPGQVIACGWCHATVEVPARGRVPKWCSPACRHRAWEQARAAASGLVAVEVRDRVVETVKTVKVVQHHSVDKPIAYRPASAAAFVEILDDLTGRLDSGRVYDRDLPTLVAAVRSVIDALNRREQPRPAHCGEAPCRARTARHTAAILNP